MNSGQNAVIVKKSDVIRGFAMSDGTVFPKFMAITSQTWMRIYTLASLIVELHYIPKSRSFEKKRKIICLMSYMAGLIEENKELALSKQNNFHSLPKIRQAFNSAYLDGREDIASFYFEELKAEPYAKVNTVQMIGALYGDDIGRGHLPASLLDIMRSLYDARIVLSEAVKEYIALEKSGELEAKLAVISSSASPRLEQKRETESIDITEWAIEEETRQLDPELMPSRAALRRRVHQRITEQKPDVPMHMDTFNRRAEELYREKDAPCSLEQEKASLPVKTPQEQWEDAIKEAENSTPREAIVLKVCYARLWERCPIKNITRFFSISETCVRNYVNEGKELALQKGLPLPEKPTTMKTL